MRPYDDVDGFADALREYLTAPDRLLRARLASRRHAQNFDLTKILDSYEVMFQKVMESKHQA